MASKGGDRRRHPIQPTVRQQRFIAEYLIDGNGTQAALRAGYSPRSAKQVSARVLSRSYIQDAILKARREREALVAEKSAIDAAWVLRELAELWRVDVRAIFQPSGELKPIHELSDAAAKLVASFEVIDTPGAGLQTKKVRIIDRLRVLEDIGKHVSVLAFKEQKTVEHTGKVGAEFTIREGDEPATLAEIAALLAGFPTLAQTAEAAN
jgi:phage terminase small subunit